MIKYAWAAIYFYNITLNFFMKKIFFFLLIIFVAINAYAQIETKPVKPVIQNINIPVKKTTDLAITINSIEDNSIPRQNQYTVHYTVTNTGTEDVSRYVASGQSIRLSGYFSGPTSETASFWGNASGSAENFQLISFEDNHSGNSILKSGESSRGTIKVCKFNPAYYDYSVYLNPSKYKFVLSVDSKNEIAETNENNNTAEYQLPLHINTPADLFLTATTVTVQTGNDNKEANNSDVDFCVGPGSLTSITNNKLFRVDKYKNEIKVNSTVSIPLNKSQAPADPQNSLEFFKQKGVTVMILYTNRVFPTDAWNISNVSVKLDFKDRFGNDLRTITINFPKANGILGYRFGDPLDIKSQRRWLILQADGNFNAKGEPVFTMVPDQYK